MQTEFACEDCGKVFKSTGTRNTHFDKVHLGGKELHCQECGKLFARSGALHVHMHLSMSCALCLAWWCFHCQSQLERPAAQLLAEEHSVNTDDPFGNVVCGLAIGFEKMS